MLFGLSSQLGNVALAYIGLSVLPDVAAAVGRGAVAAVEAALPGSYSYNNPAHLGKKIDTRA